MAKPVSRELQASYARLFSTPDGEVVIADIIERFHVLDSMGPKTKAQSLKPRDPYEMFENNGQRTVALFLLTMSNVDILQETRSMMERNKNA